MIMLIFLIQAVDFNSSIYLPRRSSGKRVSSERVEKQDSSPSETSSSWEDRCLRLYARAKSEYLTAMYHYQKQKQRQGNVAAIAAGLSLLGAVVANNSSGFTHDLSQFVAIGGGVTAIGGALFLSLDQSSKPVKPTSFSPLCQKYWDYKNIADANKGLICPPKKQNGYIYFACPNSKVSYQDIIVIQQIENEQSLNMQCN